MCVRELQKALAGLKRGLRGGAGGCAGSHRGLSSLAAPVLIPEPPFTSRASSGQWHTLSALQRLRVQNADDNNSAHLMRLL